MKKSFAVDRLFGIMELLTGGSNPFVNLGKIGHNMAESLVNTTVSTTKAKLLTVSRHRGDKAE